MKLDRLGRQTLHIQRYAKPRAISRFEGDSRPEDAGFQVIDSVETVPPEPAHRGSPAAPIGEPPAESLAHRGDAGDLQASVASLAGTESRLPMAPLPEGESPTVPPESVPADSVETVIQREFVDTRTEFETVHDKTTPAPEQVVRSNNRTETTDVDTGVLSREFKAVEARLRRLEAEPASGGPQPQPTEPSIAVAPRPSAVSLPGPLKTQEHHVEVLIEAIVVNAFPPSDKAGSTSTRRDPAEGLARFQQGRRR